MKGRRKSIYKAMFAFGVCMLLGFSSVCTAEAAETTYFHAYEKYDYETTSDRYALTVNDVPVDVVTYYEGRYDYARIAYEGTATFQVKSLNGNIESYNVSPHSYNLDVKVSGDTLTFDMEQKNSRYVVVEITAGGKEQQLFIAADPKLDIAKPDLNQSNVINIMDRGIQMPYDQADGLENSAIIQDAINDLSAAGGGTLYFPAGTYKFVTIDAKSNVTIFLDEGAVLRGSGKRTDYGWNDSGQNGRQVVRKDILIDNVDNFSIIGYGMVDANAIPLALKRGLIASPNVDNREQPDGYYPDGWDDFRKGIVDAYESDGITFKGVAFKDATGWTFNIQTSKNIDMSNVKILDDYEVVHSDGYDFCSCEDVTVTDCLGICGDDVFCPKAEYQGRDTKDMIFKDSVAYALGGAGCKVGVASRSDASNIEFNNIDVIQGYRGFTLAHDEGTGVWDDIRFIDIRTERIHVPNRNNTGGQYRPSPFVLWTLERNGQRGTVSNVEVTRCSVEDCNDVLAYIQGCKADAAVSNVTFTDLVLEGTLITEDNYDEYVVHGDNISNISYRMTGNVTGGSTGSGNKVSYEAENGSLTQGSVIMDKGIASGGKMVGDLGGTTNGICTITVNAPAACTANVDIYYTTNGTRTFYVTANNDPYFGVECEGNNWNVIQKKTIQVDLKAGDNTIKFDNGTGNWAPNLDKIDVEFLIEENQTVYEAENGTFANGAASATKGVASGGMLAANIGGPNNGICTITVDSAVSGTAYLDIYYIVNGTRTFYVTTNNDPYFGVTCEGNSWNEVKMTTVEVNLKQGSNTIKFDNGTGAWAPDLDKIEVRFPGVYEAEDGVLEDGAVVTDKSIASGGKKVGNLGGDTNGICTITVNSASAGKAYMDIYYITNGERRFYITVNNNPYFGVDCEGDSWNEIMMKTVEIELNAGANTIKFDNGADAWAPDLDKIEIRMQ